MPLAYMACGFLHVTEVNAMPKKIEPKDTQSTQPEQVQQVRISDIHPFKNHPFKVVDDALMQETVDSIMQFGVLNPTIIRPDPGGG